MGGKDGSSQLLSRHIVALWVIEGLSELGGLSRGEVASELVLLVLRGMESTRLGDLRTEA